MSTNSHIVDAVASSVVHAIRDPENWSDVLDSIIANSPACAAIITLRDKKTCQIVNDQDIERQFHSPLVRGFELEEVGYYLTELRTIDPWAERQKTSYPFHPTLMSRICPPENYQSNRFFEWLHRMHMEDTVVFELDRMAGYWTACNLFLPKRDAKDAQNLLDFSSAHFDFLRSAWKTSQVFQHSSQTEIALLEQFGDAGRACCLVGANGEFRQSNALFQTLIDNNLVRLSGPSKKISFSRSVEMFGLTDWEDHRLIRHEESSETVRATARPIEPDPRFAGKREKLWLIMFSGVSSGRVIQGDFRDVANLTAQEQRLYSAVMEGRSVADAGDAIGIRRSRAFEIWSSVKTKLNISNAHQIRDLGQS